MVLLAASVTTKSGKAIVSRQFVEMTRARIEGLLAAFPKLLTGSRQHTFVETESVRYVYQPMEKLYTLLITTKASNILEDLETLRLFTRVIPEYCKFMDEQDIVNNSFNLIFAFDEIIALGYRENVNMAQIRTFVEMDSHEEKVYQAVRQTQEKEAKQKMKEKARELTRAKQEALKKGRSPGFGSGSGSGSGYLPSSSDSMSIAAETPPPKSSYSAPSTRPTTTGKAMKLGNKNKDIDLFVDLLKSEGESVETSSSLKSSIGTKAAAQVHTESVHLRCEEKITVVAKRDGGVDLLEVHGIVTLNISDEKYGCIRIKIDNEDERGVLSQTHPNIDKELFRNAHIIGMKNSAKPFPVNVDVGVLKWRFQSQDESNVPLLINCWPSENGTGGCDVNIEYELQLDTLELSDVEINIPVMGTPVVTECEGMYEHDSRKNRLTWKLPVIDSSNRSGAMEFSCPGKPSDFFPVTVRFDSFSSYCNIKVGDVFTLDHQPVKYDSEAGLVTERYEII